MLRPFVVMVAGIVAALLAPAGVAVACGGGALGLGQTTGRPGGIEHVRGTAFAPGTPVTLSWHSASSRTDTQPLARTKADSKGNFSISFRLPTAAPGQYVIEARQPIHNRSILPGVTSGALFEVPAATGAVQRTPAGAAIPPARTAADTSPTVGVLIVGGAIAALCLLGFVLAGGLRLRWRPVPRPGDSPSATAIAADGADPLPWDWGAELETVRASGAELETVRASGAAGAADDDSAQTTSEDLDGAQPPLHV